MATTAMCSCLPPKPFDEPKVAGPSTKNPGRPFYKCDACGTFCWVDMYGQPKPNWQKRKATTEVPPLVAARNDQEVVLVRIEELDRKLDQLHALVEGCRQKTQ